MAAEFTINDKLDACASLLVETYSELITHHELLKEKLDNGFINLSKARSILGCSSLSILQVPNDLSANVTVDLLQSRISTNEEFEYTNLQYKLNLVKNNNDKIDNVSEIPMPNWFGVLTPLSLKSSQKSFASSLPIIVSLCELQAKLQNLQKTYKDLLAEK